MLKLFKINRPLDKVVVTMSYTYLCLCFVVGVGYTKCVSLLVSIVQSPFYPNDFVCKNVRPNIIVLFC